VYKATTCLAGRGRERERERVDSANHRNLVVSILYPYLIAQSSVTGFMVLQLLGTLFNEFFHSFQSQFVMIPDSLHGGLLIESLQVQVTTVRFSWYNFLTIILKKNFHKTTGTYLVIFSTVSVVASKFSLHAIPDQISRIVPGVCVRQIGKGANQ